jgi:hypothetical protein
MGAANICPTQHCACALVVMPNVMTRATARQAIIKVDLTFMFFSYF